MGNAGRPAYSPRVLPDAAAVPPVPPDMSPSSAQEWCNFVVFAPTGLPKGTAIVRSSLRHEAPPGRPTGATEGRTPWSDNNPSALRIEIAGGGRRLRLKEFFYDWAFPALDHPALWNSETSAIALDDAVMWLGVDYQDHRGASARIARTTIELSVLEGEFSDAELRDLYASLRPVDPACAGALEQTSFAERSYFVRHPEAVVLGVPIGLWQPGQPDGLRFDWRTTDGKGALPAALGGLPLDSVAAVAGETTVEVEVVYAGGPERNRELRLQRHRPANPAEVRIEPSSHPGHHEEVIHDGHRVKLGWIDNRYGPFDAVVLDADGAPVLRLLSSTGVGLDREWFLAALSESLA